MSIIYDALKKSQKARAKSQRITVMRMPGNRRTQIIATLLLLTGLFVMAVAIKLIATTTKPELAQNIQPVKLPAALPAAVEAASAPRLLLEGVFVSEREKLAMINHHAYHEGDLLNGMQVINISFEQVTLKGKSRSLTLRSDLTQFD